MTVKTKKQDRTDGQESRLFEEFPWPSYEQWRELVERQLNGVPFEKKLVTRTYEDIDLQPLYRQEDGADWTHLNSMPGFPPYTRSGSAAGHVFRRWAVSQELPYRTPAEFNRAIRHDLERGQTVINFVFDAATLFGQDPDEAQVGDVGRGGVSIATVDAGQLICLAAYRPAYGPDAQAGQTHRQPAGLHRDGLAPDAGPGRDLPPLPGRGI
jgi:methylmalonyl-CoA mutase